MKYFKDVDTLEELRKQYKELLKKYHPDNPQGSTEATQDINAEYDKLFRLLKDKHESNAEQTKNKTPYDDMVHLSNITIEVCGSWIWVSGNTYPHKEELKQYGLKYASKKKQWYWHSEAFRKKGKKALSMDDIRNYYGSTEVQTEAIKRIKEA